MSGPSQRRRVERELTRHGFRAQPAKPGLEELGLLAGEMEPEAVARLQALIAARAIRGVEACEEDRPQRVLERGQRAAKPKSLASLR